MKFSIRIRRTASFLVGAIGLCGAALPAMAHEAHQHAARPASAPSASQFETKFLKDMIDHHAMAVHMSKACSTRAQHQELRDLCEDMRTMQQQEIAQMQSWLHNWYGISHHPHMKQSEMRQMERLEALSGREFEIAFMDMMIAHHQMALREGEQCVRFAKHAELRQFCEHMHEMQKAEIAKMKGWLCAWYQKCQ